MTDKELILGARDNDMLSLINGIKRLYSCSSADVDIDGSVWVSGHWLNKDGIARIARALKDGDI